MRGPTADAIRALLPGFTGTIAQVPPRYSAIKIDGERAYDLAREGTVVEMEARPVDIHRLELVEMPDPDHAVLVAECGKGTYVRALARDLGRAARLLRACLGAAADHCRAVRRSRYDSAGTARTLCVIEPLSARETSPLCYCPLRPRWTTSRRWPSVGQMRPGSRGARPFCCVDGMLP